MEQLIKEEEDAAELKLSPVDFDLSAIKESLKEYRKVPSIKGRNKRALASVIEKVG